jgi:poly(3-hydroxybutyrate) depolymerase/endonuclease/exonuclease/phosphatase family metal-dependent hydrolase
MSMLNRLRIIALAVILFGPWCQAAQAAKIQFRFENPAGPAIDVYVTRPVGLAADRPVVFVMHGMERNAGDFRDQWHELANEHGFLLVAPEFSDADFAGPEGYDFGNVFDAAGNAQPRDNWSFAAIEPLFDEIRRRYGMTTERYAIYGHSAGAQFVHRFICHVPEARISQAVIANAGWYMMPDQDTAYPYGFRDSVIGARQLEVALQLPVTILLGEADTDPDDPDLRRTPEALEQGEHRLARGQRYFDAAQAAAELLGVPLNWKLQTVPDAGHDDTLMAPAAAELLAPLDDVPPARRPVTPVTSNPRPESILLKIMTFNARGGGLNAGKPIDETVAVLRAADADIIGLQEMRAEAEVCTAADCDARGESVAASLAAALGYHVFEPSGLTEANWANAILSRYPIGAATPNETGVAIDVDGTTVYAFNVHLSGFPYQPYQLLGIEYGDAPFLHTEREAIQAAREARKAGLDLLFEDIRNIPWNAFAIITGDFNEPSHRDWTRRAVEAGQQPLAVAFPSAHDVEKRGFTDALRRFHPDEIEYPAFTWTPVTAPGDPLDHHDRIDYVFVRDRFVDATVEYAAIVGEKSPEADIVVTPWPSDHRAVLVEVLLEPR